MAQPRGKYFSFDASRPLAKAVCDRCNFTWPHWKLRWQYQWTGPRLANLRILVCPNCYDTPQEQLRTIILPPDPVPIQNPRAEQYVSESNPNASIGQSASPLLTGTNIGTLIGGGGTWSAFDGNTTKPFRQSAYLGVSVSGYSNWVGKNWSAVPSGGPLTLTGMSTSVQVYTVSEFIMTAPDDSAFLGSSYAVAYKFQGSSDGSNWTDLATGTTAGTTGESVTVTSVTGSDYQYHRLNFNGDGTHAVAIAQLQIYTANRGVGYQP